MAGFLARRRRWTEAAKRRIVAESLVPGATVVGVARRQGINPGQLYSWRREAASAEGVGVAMSGFVPVVVEAEPAGSGPSSGPVIEIVVGAVTIRVDATVETGVLHRVMDAARRLA